MLRKILQLLIVKGVVGSLVSSVYGAIPRGANIYLSPKLKICVPTQFANTKEEAAKYVAFNDEFAGVLNYQYAENRDFRRHFNQVENGAFAQDPQIVDLEDEGTKRCYIADFTNGFLPDVEDYYQLNWIVHLGAKKYGTQTFDLAQIKFTKPSVPGVNFGVYNISELIFSYLKVETAIKAFSDETSITQLEKAINGVTEEDGLGRINALFFTSTPYLLASLQELRLQSIVCQVFKLGTASSYFNCQTNTGNERKKVFDVAKKYSPEVSFMDQSNKILLAKKFNR